MVRPDISHFHRIAKVRMCRGLIFCMGLAWGMGMFGCARHPGYTYPMLTQYEGEHLGPEATIRYVQDPVELDRMRLRVKDGLLVDADFKPLDPQVDTHPKRDGFAIFVMDMSQRIYVSFDHEQDRFHHSSILAGAAVSAAGDMTILGGKLLGISNSSGHYRPDAECIDRVLKRLSQMGVDVKQVRMSRIGQDGQRRYVPSRTPGRD